MNQLIINQNLTMSSREIAELTGKEHSDLLRDIRVQFAELYDIEKDDANLHDKLKQYLSIESDSRGYMSVVKLNKEQTYTLIAGYSVKVRNLIVKRWLELESKQPKLPTTYKDALLALIAKEEALEEAIRAKAEIGSRREATSMATASVATKKANRLEVELDKAKDYATVKRVEMATGQKYKWKALKDYSLANNLDMPKVFDANYESVRSYHADAWFECYSIDILELK